MPLNNESLAAVREWLKTKATHTAACPACGNAKADVGDIVLAPVYVAPGATTTGVTGVPMLQLLCDNCGYVRLFSAIKLGLVPSAHDRQVT